MDIKKLIEEDLRALKNKYQAKFGEYPLLSCDSVPKNGIIFIGLNPSISEKEKSELLKTSYDEFFYKHDTSKEHKHHRYFNRIVDMANELGVAWGHLDLLFMRETQQKKIWELLQSKDGLSFICDQLMISKKVIDEIIDKTDPKPKAFIVNNTLSRKFLGVEKNEELNKDIWMGYDFDWDATIGTYRHKGIPFFFTSMLTGQRALDIGSYQRLIWHVGHVFGEKWQGPKKGFFFRRI